MQTDETQAQARRRMTAVKGLYIHEFVFTATMILLAAINYATSQTLWFHWPLLGWGILVAAHALYVVGFGATLGPKWERRKMRESMDES